MLGLEASQPLGGHGSRWLMCWSMFIHMKRDMFIHMFIPCSFHVHSMFSIEFRIWISFGLGAWIWVATFWCSAMSRVETNLFRSIQESFMIWSDPMVVYCEDFVFLTLASKPLWNVWRQLWNEPIRGYLRALRFFSACQGVRVKPERLSGSSWWSS